MDRTPSFDEEMDQIWVHCCDLVDSHHIATNCPATLVKPWHLALQLLFGDLREENDRRLHTNQALLSVTPSLELPLFWTAISRVYVIRDQFHEHLAGAMERSMDARFLQQYIGQAFWKKAEEESVIHEPAAQKNDEMDPVLNRASRHALAVLTRADQISEEYGSNYVAPQHVLLALIQDDNFRSVLTQWKNLNIDALPDAIRKLRPMRVSAHRKPPLFPVMSKFATDVTQSMLDKKKNNELIDPLIGRSVELRRLIAILSKYKKNSAVLLGDPGVGKTAIAEGLAQRIVNLEVPEAVVARVFSLDLTSILASTQCKLAYEQIVTDVLNEVAEHEMRGTRAILFFDNLSEITVGGYQADGSGLDAASSMKRFFAQGTLRCVGCSTLEDYRDRIEKDGALARRFSPIHVCESTSEQATEVLRGLKPSLEGFHKVRITDGAFKCASSMAAKYFSHKRLPDAALDLIDEACVSVSLTRFRQSEEVWKLQRKRAVLGIEIRSLERQLDKQSERRLEDMQYKLLRLDEKIADSTSLRRYCNRLRHDIKVNYERRAAALLEMRKGGKTAQARLFDEIKDLDSKKEELQEKLASAESGETDETPNGVEIVHDPDPVTVREVAVTASYYTFIPAAKDSDINIANLETTLAGVVVGQSEAIGVVSGVMQSLWAGLKNPRRPITSILFGGPSGSGKTLLVKELAKLAAQQSGSLITIHASDYTMPHTLTRLIGTPVCTGFDHGGQLTECVKRKPFSVVYIKEIEQGCPELQMLIQTILDEGTARDGDGHVVDFTNCVIVLTTALGRTNLPRSLSAGQKRKHFKKEIEQHLPDEFLARIDHTVIFDPVKGDILFAMISARLEELRRQLATINLKLFVRDDAEYGIRVLLAQEDVRTARHVERWFRRQVVLPLTTLLLESDVPENAVVVLDLENDELSVRLDRGMVSVPSSPASSYYSLNPDDEEMHSDMESNSPESEHAMPFDQHEPISVVRGPLPRVQPQRVQF